MEDNYPRVFYFRPTELIENYYSFQDWESEFDGLMGIMGKSLSEEIPKTRKNVMYYSMYKKENPEQLLLLHYNGNACDPIYQTDNFYDGHWLYTEGVKITEDLPEFWSVSKIKVEDVSMFVDYTGRFFDRKEDVAIVELDKNGKPNWNVCEQAAILEIDRINNTLTLRRGEYGSRPKSFKKGKAYIAAHVIEGPWGSKHSNLMWFYNHSATCPKDKSGKQCSDILSDIISNRFKAGQPLQYYDGIELDASFKHMQNHGYFYLQNIGPGRRTPDCNADGIGDMGIINGINVYEQGVSDFYKKLREKLDKVNPNILLLADVGYAYQRAFGLVNGIETEGYEIHGEDCLINWSHLINIHGFWNANSRKPNFSYLNHSLNCDEWSSYRLAFSAAHYTGSAISVKELPPKSSKGEMGYYDELVKGKEYELAWLGKPRGDAIHLVLNETNLLGEGSIIDKIWFINCFGSIENKSLKLKGKEKEDDMKIIIPNIQIESNELCVVINASCKAMKDYSPEIARIITVRPIDENGESVLDDKEWWWKFYDRRYTYANSKAFRSYIYFPKLPVQKVDIEIVFEGTEDFTIEDLQIFSAPDAMYREFENGLVITNPGIHEYTFYLSEISPDKRYKRIQGTEFQDPITNNGEKIEKEITLGKHDALFLVKD